VISNWTYYRGEVIDLGETVITQNFVEQIVCAQPDEAARQAMRHGLIDYLACALPVSWGAVPDSDLETLRRQYPATTPENRALRLGYISHALDFDDFLPGFRGHPSVVILSTLLPLLAEHPVSMQALLDAAVIGVEVAGRLGQAAGAGHYQQGFHNSATLGCLAATAAAARLEGLTAPQLAVALGLAATQAAGLRSQFGSNAKPLHIGLAARNALTAVRLAQLGFHGNESRVIEDFLPTHGGTLARPALLQQAWALPWQVIQPGLQFKPYPTCSGTHSAIEAALALRVRLQQRFHQPASWLSLIQRIVVRFPPGADTATSVRTPVDGLQARFSLEYVIADTLLHGEIRLEHYQHGELDAGICLLAAQVSREVDHAAPDDATHPDGRFHQVEIHLLTGEVWSQHETRAQTVARPLDLLEKLRRQIRRIPGLDPEQILAACHTPGDTSAAPLLHWLRQDLG